MYLAFSSCDSYGRAHATDLTARADEAIADNTASGDPKQVVRDAYVHRHSPDVVTVHPFKDTPLGVDP